jgi:two-component system sensor histidine kinase KdpD
VDYIDPFMIRCWIETIGRPSNFPDPSECSADAGSEGRSTGVGLAAVRETEMAIGDFATRQPAIRYGLALLPVAIVTALGEIFHQYLSQAILSLSYFLVVVLVSVNLGRGPALIISLISVLILDFLFIEPIYSLRIYSTEDIITLTFFLVVAVVASRLAARLRQQMLLARSHAETTASLYAFSRELTGIANLDALFAAVARETSALLRAKAVLLGAEGGRLVQRSAQPAGTELEPLAASRAEWAWLHEEARATVSDSGWRFAPLRTARGAVGVLAVMPEPAGSRVSYEHHRLLQTVAELASVAVERQYLADEIDEISINREVARLGTVLLASVAHDLRTPIGSALSALSALESDQALLDATHRRQLLSMARRETERLNRFINNLLEVTRLESGALELRRELADPMDVVASAVSRGRDEFPGRSFAVDVIPDLPLIAIDSVLIELALFNVLHNGAKYAPPGSAIEIVVRPADGGVIVRVLDEGPGIPAEQLERIFEKFHRVRLPNGSGPIGTGLGLAISRGFIEAHGGTVTAANRTDRRGAVFTIALPGQTRAGTVA